MPDTEAGSGVGDLKQRMTLGHILGLRNWDVGRLDDQRRGAASPWRRFTATGFETATDRRVGMVSGSSILRAFNAR